MEFKLFINSNLIDYCLKEFDVIFSVPSDSVEECKKFISQRAKVIPSRYPSHKMLNIKRDNNILTLYENFIRQILALTYPKNKNYEKCISQEFQIKSYKNAQSNRSFLSKLRTTLVINLAQLASFFYFFRKFIQLLAIIFLRNSYHQDIFRNFNPSLVVVGSMGLDADGYAIYEAKKNSVKSVVINQSWDRTVCKGYPVIHPDEIIVWNHHMKDEAKYYLEMNNNNIHVEGAPPWDFLFHKENLQNKNDFVKSLDLDPAKPLIYYPMSSAFWHKDLIENISDFYEASVKNIINKDIQIIFRVHPYYWRNKKLRRELFEKLDKLKKIKNFYINYNQVGVDSNYSFLHPKDQNFVLNCYKHSDVCISVTSSSMVEMILSGKPSINFLYGDWKLDNQYIKMKDFLLHHLEKLYSYNIIKHVYSFNDLIMEVNNLKDLELDKGLLNKFIEGEFPNNRGNSAEAYSKRLKKILVK